MDRILSLSSALPTIFTNSVYTSSAESPNVDIRLGTTPVFVVSWHHVFNQAAIRVAFVVPAGSVLPITLPIVVIFFSEPNELLVHFASIQVLLESSGFSKVLPVQ